MLTQFSSSFSVTYFFKEGEQCSGLPCLLSFFLTSLFATCATLFFSSTLSLFPFLLRQMLSLSCSHLFNPPVHRTVCPSPSNSYIVIKFLIQLFICTVASTRTNRSPAVQGSAAVIRGGTYLKPAFYNLESELQGCLLVWL